MSRRYEPIDLALVKTYSIGDRAHKASSLHVAPLPDAGASLAALLQSLPDYLGVCFKLREPQCPWKLGGHELRVGTRTLEENCDGLVHCVSLGRREQPIPTGLIHVVHVEAQPPDPGRQISVVTLVEQVRRQSLAGEAVVTPLNVLLGSFQGRHGGQYITLTGHGPPANSLRPPFATFAGHRPNGDGKEYQESG